MPLGDKQTNSQSPPARQIPVEIEYEDMTDAMKAIVDAANAEPAGEFPFGVSSEQRLVFLKQMMARARNVKS
jgi:hypothetical protein